MAQILALTEYELPRHECQKLEEQVRQSYKAPSPKISRLLRVLKEDPKLLVESITQFTLDSGRSFVIIEKLDKPGGLTVSIEVNEIKFDGAADTRHYEPFGTLSAYCLAEREIMAISIAEERAETD